MSSTADNELQRSIQQSLQDLADQMGHPIEQSTAQQLYYEATDLLDHLSYEPLTLARVAGTLLVYRVQKIEVEEVDWFKQQVRQCPDEEEVEELIESLHRTDGL
ncbi:hypothetical protein [Leptolyngbya sp. 7M]|uniref:hypothetical protein n=1 Tax=Leptolyngbya sp. 7M TaxID=2812896 RepID=UPI001B8D8D85|nr:hypothetical protein [Leptolyngbya sp. 7M]QYO62303.1 hypothetical protein JVX88_19620 [Leptolyngbya sp. 7M]